MPYYAQYILLNIFLALSTFTKLHPLESSASEHKFKLSSDTSKFITECQTSSKMNKYSDVQYKEIQNTNHKRM